MTVTPNPKRIKQKGVDIMRNARSKKLNTARNMPPLVHSIPGINFDIKDSKVVQWLIQQPDIQQMVFEKVKNCEIVYDPKTSTWKGVDYPALCPHGDDWDLCPDCCH